MSHWQLCYIRSSPPVGTLSETQHISLSFSSLHNHGGGQGSESKLSRLCNNTVLLTYFHFGLKTNRFLGKFKKKGTCFIGGKKMGSDGLTPSLVFISRVNKRQCRSRCRWRVAGYQSKVARNQQSESMDGNPTDVFTWSAFQQHKLLV